jgi:hypothetical protein
MNIFVGVEKWSTKEFVAFWKHFYDHENYSEDFYNDNLNEGHSLTEQNVSELLAWKFGDASLGPEERRKSVSRWFPLIQRNLSWLNDLRSRIDEAAIEDYVSKALNEVRTIEDSLVVAIFFLHIAQPRQIPIFDRYVRAAWYYVTQHKLAIDAPKLPEEYVPYRRFFYVFSEKSCCQGREIDKALWAFGKFLSDATRLR